MAEGINSGNDLQYKNGSFTNVRRKDGMRFGASLNDIAAAKLLPTPTTQEIVHKDAEITPNGRRKSKSGDSHSINIANLAHRGLLCTPTAQASRGNTSDARGKGNLTDQIAEMKISDKEVTSLSPKFVAEMMGYPSNYTELPFMTKSDKLKQYDMDIFEQFPSENPICNESDFELDALNDLTFRKWREGSIEAYGNAIVPQVAMQIFRAIEQYENL